MKQDEEGRNQILEFAKEILNGDKTNREAHAAKVYFNLLMGTSFSRGNENILLNSALDYGYAVLRSYIARACVGYGLNTQIGIHHKNELNNFNLADDFIEAFRPSIDLWTAQNVSLKDEFSSEIRRKLVDLLNYEVIIAGKRQAVLNAINVMLSSFTTSIQLKDYNKLLVPRVVPLERHIYG